MAFFKNNVRPFFSKCQSSFGFFEHKLQKISSKYLQYWKAKKNATSRSSFYAKILSVVLNQNLYCSMFQDLSRNFGKTVKKIYYLHFFTLWLHSENYSSKKIDLKKYFFWWNGDWYRTRNRRNWRKFSMLHLRWYRRGRELKIRIIADLRKFYETFDFKKNSIFKNI